MGLFDFLKKRKNGVTSTTTQTNDVTSTVSKASATEKDLKTIAATLLEVCSPSTYAKGQFPSIEIMKIGVELSSKYEKDVFVKVINLIEFPPARELIESTWKNLGLL